MAESDYWNFDVTVVKAEGSAGGYEVEAECQDLHWPATIDEWTFEGEELAGLRAAIEGPARDAKRAEQGEAVAKQDHGAEVRRFGEVLFDTFFGDDIRARLDSSLEKAQKAGKVGLRIRLCLEKVPEIAQLPWEYLYRKDKGGQALSIYPETPIVRYTKQGTPPSALEASPPIRVLVMIPNPKGLNPLDSGRELKNIQDALKLQPGEEEALIELDTVPVPTILGLQNQLQKKEYHVFHFIGHGDFDPGKEAGVLLFEEDDKTPKQVSAGMLRVALNHPTLRLVVLNSCEGAQSGTRDPFAGIAQQLAQEGKWATIAMQFRITDKAAISFASTFYRALANNYAVDAALVEARKAIFFEGNPTEWGTPVLFMRAEEGRVFNIPTGAALLQAQIKALKADAMAAIDIGNYKLAVEKLEKILSKL